MRSGFDELALIEPLLRGLCIDMMQTIASYLCRGIEAVITGLTRNQFVDNTTRGFESLPLRQTKKRTFLVSVRFCFVSRSLVNTKAKNLHAVNIPCYIRNYSKPSFLSFYIFIIKKYATC